MGSVDGHKALGYGIERAQGPGLRNGTGTGPWTTEWYGHRALDYGMVRAQGARLPNGTGTGYFSGSGCEFQSGIQWFAWNPGSTRAQFAPFRRICYNTSRPQGSEPILRVCVSGNDRRHQTLKRSSLFGPAARNRQGRESSRGGRYCVPGKKGMCIALPKCEPVIIH